MKIRPVGVELFHADGYADGHDEANSRFSKFCKCAWKRTKDRSDVQHIYSCTLSKLLFGPYSSLLDCISSVNPKFTSQNQKYLQQTLGAYEENFYDVYNSHSVQMHPIKKIRPKINLRMFSVCFASIWKKITHQHIKVQNNKPVRLKAMWNSKPNFMYLTFMNPCIVIQLWK
jgi:hypothetical protein